MTTPRSAAGSSIDMPAGDVEIDVLAGEAVSGLLLDEGEKHGRPVMVEADGHAPRDCR